MPPLYAIIARDLEATEGSMGLVTAVYLFVVAIAAIFWGYRGDQQRRKPLLFFSTLLWAGAMILTALARSYAQFFWWQMVTAVGVGGIASVGFSVVSDLVPAARRGLALAFWSISQGVGGSLGSLLAGVMGAGDWRLPFLFIAGLGFLFAFLYLFTWEPQRGQAEPELAAVFASGQRYEYRIRRDELLPMLRQGSTRWLLAASFTFALAYGSTLWIPRWAIARVQADGYGLETATIAGNMFVALFSLGAFTAVLSGYLGDKWQKRNPRGRALLVMGGLLAAIPFFVLLYFIPLQNLNLPPNATMLQIAGHILLSLFTNPWVLLAFLAATLALIFQAVDAPNWAAMMTDANLPEHRGTVIGLSRLTRAVGSALSVGIAGGLLDRLAAPAPNNYAITLALFQLVVIPTAFCYYMVSKTIAQDVTAVKETLTTRATIGRL
ncbi:MAG: MFS transporter [Anaerolineae bacterium]|nr:MFS transporter [Anaerolineae bacterium]